MKLRWQIIFLAGIMALFNLYPAFARDKADTVYINGKIYTVNSAMEWAQAIAIKDGRFLKVGTDKEILTLKGDRTVTVDLKGAFVMPGIIDEHIHPDMGADNFLNIFLSPTDSWETVTQTIKAYRKKNPDKRWIYGGNLNWLMDNGENIVDTDIPSHKSALDKIIDDRPVALWDQGVHAMLVNTMALKELGITKETPDPAGGIIVRDAAGEATGVIRETVCTLVTNSLDNFSHELWTREGMKPFMEEMSSYGVTGMNDAYGTRKNLEAYKALQDEEELNMRLHVTMVSPLEYNNKDQAAAQDQLIRNRADYATDLILPNGVKYVLDGSAAGKTAVMLEPFIGTDFRGDLRYDVKKVQKEIGAYEKLGLAVKAHAIGDRSIRLMLDTLEKLPPRTSGTRHSISHGPFVNPEDISRFGQTGIVYEASPALWFPNPGAEVIKADIGEERLAFAWPIKELIRTGALVSYGSDWTVSFSPNPWPALESIVTREKPGGSDNTFNGKFAVELSTAIRIFTLNSARAIGLDQETGSISEGKSADMIILDRNPFTASVYDIHRTQVSKTIFRGKEVYSQPKK